MYILSNSSYITTVTLEIGDKTKNAILKIAQTLPCVDEVSQLTKNNIQIKEKITAQLPKVVNYTLPPISTIYSKNLYNFQGWSSHKNGNGLMNP